jgi:hypothetical protein
MESVGFLSDFRRTARDNSTADGMIWMTCVRIRSNLHCNCLFCSFNLDMGEGLSLNAVPVFLFTERKITACNTHREEIIIKKYNFHFCTSAFTSENVWRNVLQNILKVFMAIILIINLYITGPPNIAVYILNSYKPDMFRREREQSSETGVNLYSLQPKLCPNYIYKSMHLNIHNHFYNRTNELTFLGIFYPLDPNITSSCFCYWQLVSPVLFIALLSHYLL